MKRITTTIHHILFVADRYDTAYWVYSECFDSYFGPRAAAEL
jgi:hypothetical protein